MPATQAPDDIFALFSRFDLDMAQYRVFESASIAAKTELAQLPDADTTELEFPSAASLNEVAPEAFGAPVSEREKAGSRAALGSLQRVLRMSRERATVRDDAKSIFTISIVGAAGGVGVSTIAATLARQLNKDGERCGIYDSNANTLLPIFFENHQLTSRHHRFRGLHSLLDSSVRILTPQNCAEIIQAQSGNASSHVEALTQHFAADFDHLLVDSGRNDVALAQGMKIYVAVPDVASLFGMQGLAAQWAAEGCKKTTICVLNRFDGGLALHQELRSWYEEHFAEVFTIDNSPLVAEALAEGGTVVDWAPQSDAAGDFVRLAGYLKRAAQAKLPAASASKNQPEGLALCS